MPGVDKQTKPYELLIRWNEAGELAGAHVRFITRYRDHSGGQIPPVLGDALPVDLHGTGGFPLGDVLNEAEIAAVAAVNSSRLAADALAAERAGLDDQISSLAAALKKAEEKHRGLESECDKARRSEAETAMRLSAALNEIALLRLGSAA